MWHAQRRSADEVFVSKAVFLRQKKVNAFKDGFLIAIEILTLFFKFKIFRKKIIS